MWRHFVLLLGRSNPRNLFLRRSSRAAKLVAVAGALVAVAVELVLADDPVAEEAARVSLWALTHYKFGTSLRRAIPSATFVRIATRY